MKRVYRDKKASVHWSAASKRRALLVPVINRLSTGDFVPAFGLHRISLVRASGETLKRRFFDYLDGTSEASSLDEQFCWHTVLPYPAPPPRHAPRLDPPVVSPGFELDSFMQGISGIVYYTMLCYIVLYHNILYCTVLYYTIIYNTICRIQNPDIPRAGRVGAPGGAAGRGRARLRANRIIRPGNKSPPSPPRHRRNVASTSLQKHEQTKSYVNRRGNKICV